MEEKQKKSKECPHSSILDFNLSWVLLFVYLGYLLGIWFAQRSTVASYIPSDYSGAPYFLVSIIGGVVLTFFIYNLGKIIFAKIAGYRVLYIHLLGFIFDYSSGKLNFSYNIMSFFEVSMQFTPKDDDVKKNPKLIFIGGYIAELLLIAIALVIFFVLGPNGKTTRSAVAWTAMFMMSYGFLTPLYEILPFRQDYPTDMFNLLVVNTPDDKIAFNVVQINKRREIAGLDYMTYEFDSYESFYKSRVLFANYLDHLYASRLEKAFTVLESMRYYNKFYSDNDRYIPAGETIYLRYLIDDDAGADQQYLALKKDDKKEVATPVLLSDYRTAVLIAGYIALDKEKIVEIAGQFDKVIASYGDELSKRVLKEKELFNSAYNKVRKAKPELSIPERA